MKIIPISCLKLTSYLGTAYLLSLSLNIQQKFWRYIQFSYDRSHNQNICIENIKCCKEPRSHYKMNLRHSFGLYSFALLVLFNAKHDV